MSESFDTLLRLAALLRSTIEADLLELDRKFDELTDADKRLLFYAWRLLEGKPAVVTPAWHQTVAAFAQYVGATLEESAWSGLLVFRPPPVAQ